MKKELYLFDQLSTKELQDVSECFKLAQGFKVKGKQRPKYPCYQCGAQYEKRSNHLLQKNGLLSNIADNQGMIRFFCSDFFKSIETNKAFRFMYKGINSALRFNGLCNKCDDKLFSYVEKGHLDLDCPRSHFLFSKRAHVSEMRSQDILIKNHELLEKKPVWPKISHVLKRQVLSFQMRLYLLKEFYSKYFKSYHRDNFVFKHRIIPKIGVACSSSLGSFDTTMPLYRHYFFHILPLENSTCISISTNRENAKDINIRSCDDYPPEVLFYNFETMNDDEVCKISSDILLLCTKDWVISEPFYQSNIAPREQRIFGVIKSGFDIKTRYETLGYGDITLNLFNPKT